MSTIAFPPRRALVLRVKCFMRIKSKIKQFEKKQETATHSLTHKPDQNTSMFGFQVVEVVYTVTSTTIFPYSHIFIHSEEFGRTRQKETGSQTDRQTERKRKNEINKNER